MSVSVRSPLMYGDYLVSGNVCLLHMVIIWLVTIHICMSALTTHVGDYLVNEDVCHSLVHSQCCLLLYGRCVLYVHPHTCNVRCVCVC